MPKKKPTPVEDLVIPPQDNRICGTICVCQMTFVLSTVAIVYLTVAVYVPFTRAYKSGISEQPIMCTTTRNISVETCDWGSCGEWCLSKTSGACTQVYVNLRQNGSTILLLDCTSTKNRTCDPIDQIGAKRSRCIADECKNLTGIYNCTEGMCMDITEVFECIFKETEPPLKCSGRRGKITCIDLTGLYKCRTGTCEKIKTPYNCDRKCADIPTHNKNVIMLSGDKVYLSQCNRAVDMESGEEVWNETQNQVMMTSCYNVEDSPEGIVATDCINGTLMSHDVLSDITNFTFLNYLSVTNTVPLHKERRIAPPEVDLLIANDSKLLINLEGCVNTLQDECREFIRVFGKDGSDHNARARFPCFYSLKDIGFAVVRFNLESTTQQFIIASTVPTILMVVSCLILILCQRTVVVGDDAKMRFQGCNSTEEVVEKSTSNNNLADRGGGDSIMAL